MAISASFKVCIFGDSGVGKTSLTYRYVSERFVQDTKSTIGVDIVAKDIKIRNYNIKLQIWDFGGEERFKSFLPIYSRGSSGGIYMYDITNVGSLDNIDQWLSLFRKNLIEGDIPILGVGGKSDLIYEREISYDKAKFVATQNEIYEIIECSAKTGENIEKIFESITIKMLRNARLI